MKRHKRDNLENEWLMFLEAGKMIEPAIKTKKEIPNQVTLVSAAQQKAVTDGD